MSNKRRHWTPNEDRLLGSAIEAQRSSEFIAWSDVAKKVPGRSNRDCRKRWINTLASAARVGPWSPSEDERLAEAVQSEGARWTKVSLKVGTRNGDQCAKHWTQTSNPEIDRGEWSHEEELRLLSAFQTHGPNWSHISQHYFPSRSALAVKNRYSCIARKQTTATEAQTTRSHRSTPPIETPPSGSSADVIGGPPSESHEEDDSDDTEGMHAAGNVDVTNSACRTTDQANRETLLVPGCIDMVEEPHAFDMSEPPITRTMASTPSNWWNDDNLLMGDLAFLPHDLHNNNNGCVSVEPAIRADSDLAPHGRVRPTHVQERYGESAKSITSRTDKGHTKRHARDKSSEWAAVMAMDATSSSSTSSVPTLLTQTPTTAVTSESGQNTARSGPSSQSYSLPEQLLLDKHRSEPRRLRHITIDAQCDDEQLATMMQAVVSNSVSWRMTSNEPQ